MQQTALPGFSEKADATEVWIFVDHRELKSGAAIALYELGAKLKPYALEVGDYILSDRACVERKTYDDFVNSILDSRLFLQAKNLRDNFERPLVVIEGERGVRAVHKNAVLGAIASVMIDYNIPVVFTADASETAALLFAIAKREQLQEKREVRLLGERKAFTLAEQQQQIVETLPMVGPKLAKELLRHFKSVEKVFKASDKRLRAVEGVGEKRAKRIREVLTKEYA